MDTHRDILPIRAFDRFSGAGKALPQALRALSMELGLPGGSRICVISRATGERRGIRGRHARLWKGYSKEIGPALHHAFGDAISWEPATHSHHLDATAYDRQQLTAVLGPHYSHLVFEDLDEGVATLIVTGAQLGLTMYENLPPAKPVLFSAALQYPKWVVIGEITSAVAGAARLDKRHTTLQTLVFSVPPSVLNKDRGEPAGRLSEPRYWDIARLAPTSRFATRLPLLLVKLIVSSGGPRIATYNPLTKEAVLRVKSDPGLARQVERDYIASQRAISTVLIHAE